MGKLLFNQMLNRTPTNDTIGGHVQNEALGNEQMENDYFEETSHQK